MELINRDTYRLSTGREFYAHLAIIGLRPTQPDDDQVEFFNGYDGSTTVRCAPYFADTESRDDWTPSEKRELADFMIALWNEWAVLP